MSADAMTDGKPRKDRPVWLRVVVQVGLAAVLSVVVAPLVGVALSPLTVPVYRLGKSAGASKTELFLLIAASGALPYLLTGALAALLTWWIVRKAWDVLGYCALHGALILILNIMMYPREPQYQAWQWWQTMVASQIPSLFTGAAIVALLLQRRKTRADVRPTDQHAFLP